MKTVKLDADFGDAWINFYKFELLHGTKEQQVSREREREGCLGNYFREREIACLAAALGPLAWLT